VTAFPPRALPRFLSTMQSSDSLFTLDVLAFLSLGLVLLPSTEERIGSPKLTASNQCLACAGLRPRGSRLFSHNEQAGVVFCSGNSMNLPDMYFEAQSHSSFDYRLLSSCLRLEPSVAIRPSRLAASGLLGLARWGSHPLFDAPLSWRTARYRKRN